MSETLHRRDFVRGLAVVGSVAGLGRSARADDDPDKKDPDLTAEINARMDLILSRYGASLDEAARNAIRLDLESIVRRADALRQFELTNGDEPFPVFIPYRSPLS